MPDPFADETSRPTGVYIEVLDADGNTLTSATYTGSWELIDKLRPIGRLRFERAAWDGQATRFDIWARATHTRIGTVALDPPHDLRKGDYINVNWDGIELHENTPTPTSEGH